MKKKIILSRSESFDIENYYNGIYREKKYNKEKNKDKEKDNYYYEYYYTKNGNKIMNNDHNRILKLKIPPSWENVWVSNNENTNIQVIGLDNKKKKQYIYSDKHIEQSKNNKFKRIYNFTIALPLLEKNMKIHKKKHYYSKYSIIVTMLIIIKELFLRVGKEEYAKHNESYGISSLKKKHIKLNNGIIQFKFKGKSNQMLEYSLKNKYVYDHIKKMLQLDGDKLFKYVDNDKIKKISYVDINKYIQKYMGKEFSAKDFRTYAANFYFIKMVLNNTRKNFPKNNKIIKNNLYDAIEKTAKYLRHTKFISKKSYIMDFCVELYQTNTEFFVKNKNEDPNDVLLKIFKMAKKN
jgi:DNA topoisomerase I